MNSKLKLVIGAMLIGAATLASAQTQTRAQAFADQFKQMQSLQDTGTYTFKPAPTVRTQSDNPVGDRSFSDAFAQMQSLQDTGTYTFKPAPVMSAKPADPVGRESFADTFSRMQAVSSNSGEFKSPPGTGTAASATADNVNIAKPASQPPTQEPVAVLRSGGNTTPTAN